MDANVCVKSQNIVQNQMIVDSRLMMVTVSRSVLVCCDFITLVTLEPCFCAAISVWCSLRSPALFPLSGCFGYQVYFWWLFKLMKHMSLDQHNVSGFSLSIACFPCLGKPGVSTSHTTGEIQHRLPPQQLTQCVLLEEKINTLGRQENCLQQ